MAEPSLHYSPQYLIKQLLHPLHLSRRPPRQHTHLLAQRRLICQPIHLDARRADRVQHEVKPAAALVVPRYIAVVRH